MLACSVQIISRLDSHSKFQKFTLFSSRHVGVQQIEVHQHGSYILHGSFMGSVNLCKTFRRMSKVWEDAQT